MEALIDGAEAFGEQRYLSLESADTRAKQMLLQIQERLRLRTQVVRNWGSFQQVVDNIEAALCRTGLEARGGNRLKRQRAYRPVREVGASRPAEEHRPHGDAGERRTAKFSLFQGKLTRASAP